jgi:hypothetical protein
MREDTEDEIEEAEELELDDVPDHELSDDEALLEDDDLEDDLAFDDDDTVELEEGTDEEEVEATSVAVVDADVSTVEDEDDDLDDDDDIEASLDVILKERLVVADDTDDEDDEVADAEDRADGTMRVLPKQPGEFVCQSCFLVKHQGQLADTDRMLCRDCV